MYRNLLKLVRTLLHLKFIQIWFQVYYRIFNNIKYTKFNKKVYANILLDSIEWPIIIQKNSKRKIEFLDDGIKFEFLNFSKKYQNFSINWNESDFGKLWTYNLNYFEFLKDCSKEQSELLIQNYIKHAELLQDGLESYPTSLRIFNWIKFALYNKFNDDNFLNFIRSDVERLQKNKEFQIQANHLLENAIALFLASIFFTDRPYKESATKLLVKELKEQFGETDIHYEGSFMYHTVLIDRLLDLYQFTKVLAKDDIEVLSVLNDVISKGMNVVRKYSFNEQLPMFNDANEEETIPTLNLFEKLRFNEIEEFKGRNKCFYTFLQSKEYTVIADFTDIQPTYQPGHAHADTFSFVMYHNNTQIIVDPGCSTYEKNELRQKERSTSMHNTICYGNENSSEVWGGFRVGRRSKVTNLYTTENEVSADQDGYKSKGAKHSRKIVVDNQVVIISDTIIEKNENIKESFIHFHPKSNLQLHSDHLVINNNIIMNWEGVISWEIDNYEYAIGFNNRIQSKAWKGIINNKCILKFSTI